ncbi:MAG: serine hydrolase [Lachnospiraceae bacterium]|nr:serine hydrolase [Lachnospiraceae bacterium]
MASWMIHLRIADRLLCEPGELDETAFIMGNIAPDSGVPNEDWSRFTPPKDISHFKTKSDDELFFDIDKFRAEYFNDELIKTYNKKQYSFFLGYYMHLLTDIEWTREIYTELLKAYPEEAKVDKNKLVWTAKGDWYDLDFLYLEQHPDFRAFSIYEKAVDYENEFMDMFSKDAFENRRQYICGFYRGDQHGNLHREYIFLTPERADKFVSDTVDKLIGIWTCGRSSMQFKKGLGWKACHDLEKNTYTAKSSWRGSYQLYEIDAETYDKLDGSDKTDELIRNGRVLFESDDDYYCLPYYKVFDENYKELAPWSGAERIAIKTDVLDKKGQIVDQFPAVALAYGSEDEGSHTQYFGVSDKESSSSVDEETVFPACSISKFVTSICVMKMQELQMVDIDKRVNEYLHQWKLLTVNGEESDATVRALLSHTAGIIDGDESFYGLRITDPEVCLLDILEGHTQYNNRPVRAEKQQGTGFEYSDAGYCVLQQMMQDITGKEFSALLNELIFDELGMEHSFFASPGERENHKTKMTTGYDEAGLPIPGKFPVTPDLAASGMWSTPKDLMTLATAFFNALHGKSTFLQADTAREIIKPVAAFPWAGLGVFLDGKDMLISKGWGENGQCMMKLHLKSGDVSVVMTNKNPGVPQEESGIEWLVNSYVYFIWRFYTYKL